MPDETRRWLSEGERAGVRFALQTPRQAPVGVAGGSLSQRAGSSLEFRDHRDYQPGDDLQQSTGTPTLAATSSPSSSTARR